MSWFVLKSASYIFEHDVVDEILHFNKKCICLQTNSANLTNTIDAYHTLNITELPQIKKKLLKKKIPLER